MAHRPHFLEPLLKRSAEPLGLYAADAETPVASTLEAAFESATRNRGLLGRAELPVGTALILAPCNGIHTFFMRFPIDVIFAARDGRVLKIRANVRPWRITLGLGAFAAIELAAGAAAQSGVRVGNQLVLRP